MANIEQNYLDDLEKYLNTDEIEQEEIGYTLIDDVKDEDLRNFEEILISIVVDKSYPMNGSDELEKCIEKAIESINYVFNMDLTQSRNLNAVVAITYFGSEIELEAFKYAKHIEVNCVANQVKSRIYDAVYESCMHMIGQYEHLSKVAKIYGYMFIFSDGEDNGSTNTLQEMQQAIFELRKRDIRCVPIEYNGANLKHMTNIFKSEPLPLENPHQVMQMFEFVSERPK